MGKYVFGPVPSRRLGWSLGIDVMPKLKTCTYNCVYCEVGKTSLKGFVSKDCRLDFPPHFIEEFTSELRDSLTEHPYVKAITFGYNGEPTLQNNLSLALDIVRKVRFEAGLETTPIVILTNSSTFEYPDIRECLSKFDIVIAKLDAGLPHYFKHTNQPHHSVPPIDQIKENIKKLKSEMKMGCKLYIQSLLYKVQPPSSIQSNATGDNIVAIANAINEIQPDQVQIYTVARQPAERSVRKLSKIELIELSDLMASNAKKGTEIYYFP